MEIRMIYKKGNVDMIIIKDREDSFIDTDEALSVCMEKLAEYMDSLNEHERTTKFQYDFDEDDWVESKMIKRGDKDGEQI